MPIAWCQSLVIDDGKIDDDHRHMITLTNAFEVLVDQGADSLDLKNILMDIVNLTQHHFEHEESVQRLRGFDEGERHARHHRALLSELETVCTLFINDPCKNNRGVRSAMAHLLRCWIDDHIVAGDAGFRAHMQGLAIAA